MTNYSMKSADVHSKLKSGVLIHSRSDIQLQHHGGDADQLFRAGPLHQLVDFLDKYFFLLFFHFHPLFSLTNRFDKFILITKGVFTVPGSCLTGGKSEGFSPQFRGR